MRTENLWPLMFPVLFVVCWGINCLVSGAPEHNHQEPHAWSEAPGPVPYGVDYAGY